jgi:hypothetical protein
MPLGSLEVQENRRREDGTYCWLNKITRVPLNSMAFGKKKKNIMLNPLCYRTGVHSFQHRSYSFINSLSHERSKASSKVISPHSAI